MSISSVTSPPDILSLITSGVFLFLQVQRGSDLLVNFSNPDPGPDPEGYRWLFQPSDGSNQCIEITGMSRLNYGGGSGSGSGTGGDASGSGASGDASGSGDSNVLLFSEDELGLLISNIRLPSGLFISFAPIDGRVLFHGAGVSVLGKVL